MATAQLDGLRQMFDRVRDSADGGDGELLTRYRTLRDQDAFGSIVRRHAPMVLGVCRRVLRDHHAADDAFQATFLVLARKADAVRPPNRLGPWLYGVAYRTALKARGRAFRRRQVEHDFATSSGRTVSESRDADGDDLRPLIDEQLNALPEKYRTPLVLCAIQGLNKSEAALQLGLPEGTVSSRLARARDMLRERLLRRGVVVPATAFALLVAPEALQAAVSPALAASAVSVAGSTAIPATILILSHEVIRSMTLLKLKFLGAVALSVSLAGGGLGLVALQADDKKPVQQGEKPAVQPEKPKPAKPDGDKPKPDAEKQKPDGQKPKPDPQKPKPEKPEKPGLKSSGRVASVDAKENTITLAFKGDGGIVEKVVKVAPNAKVFVDGKEAKLADVPKNAMATFVAPGAKEGTLPEATEIRVSGPTFAGPVKQIDSSSVTIGTKTDKTGGGGERVVKLAPGGKVMIGEKEAKLSDLQVGQTVTLASNEAGAVTIAVAMKKPGGDKPKPPDQDDDQ
jgi:RNA polymerase sigma factor (sigma-70 family)